MSEEPGATTLPTEGESVETDQKEGTTKGDTKISLRSSSQFSDFPYKVS